MSNEKVKKIHLVYGCITGLLILGMCIGLVICCVNIYTSGDRPFSRESIAMAAQQLAVPGWLCLIAVLGGVFLHFLLPIAPAKTKPVRSDKDLLARFESNFALLPEEGQKAICAETKRILAVKWLAAGLIAASFIYPVVYFSDASHFGVADINGDVMRAVLICAVPCIFAFVCIYVCGRIVDSIVSRQIQVYKEHGVKPGSISDSRTNGNQINIIRCILVGAAFALIVLGIGNDGIADVLGKAIRICTECIGLG